MYGFTIKFALLVLVLFTLEVLKPVEVWFVIPYTEAIAKVSTFLISLFDDDALTYGKIIQSASSGFAVSIERGCNGLEAVIILAAAIFAFPATFKQRMVGFSLGFLAIQLLNLVRIISLFYIGQYSKVWFEWFHLYLWQALIILDALVVWLLWLRWLPKQRRKAPPRDPPGAAPMPA